MSVRVVARIRPLLAKELEKDIIVRAESAEPGKPTTIVKIPNPRNEDEEFSFTFNGVYDRSISQEALFASEVAPCLKSLFQGVDVTIFAYGVTGTGKTHTMRGGLRLADRGVIPRLLSGIFRRGKKMMKETEGNTMVQVLLSYYEVYNDRIFDLLDAPEKRTAAGLPLRAEANGKTVVAGLTERACGDLKDFEKLYIEANNNRVTASTKLNSHSSRSHAVLRVTVRQTTGNVVRESTASTIDLAGSEDNRRTDNGKERLVESAAINKSLFVLGQCIDAISRGDKRIPYRESKMTRILSLGQNNGVTVMILNLSPMRCCHLDTLSSLNISSRAKRIEVREIENEVVFKQAPRGTSGSAGGGSLRQPLRPLANAVNTHNVRSGNAAKAAEGAKPVKAFSVFSDVLAKTGATPQKRSQKRPSDTEAISRPSKLARPAKSQASAVKTEETATRSDATSRPRPVEDAKAEGLRHLLAARQAKAQGDDEATLRAYELALPYFPDETRLIAKMEKLRARVASSHPPSQDDPAAKRRKRIPEEEETKRRKPTILGEDPATPRTQHLLNVINSRDEGQIKTLAGFGAKRAHELVGYLALAEEDGSRGVESLAQLRAMPGMSGRAVDRAYEGLL